MYTLTPNLLYMLTLALFTCFHLFWDAVLYILDWKAGTGM